jgi:penicillin-binding protein 2
LKNPRKVNFNFRYNLTTVLVYLIGIVLIVQLFNLQVVHGEEYRASSNARLTRESDIEAARGNIEDRNESILATTKTGYSVELYKTKIKDEELNNVALKIANLLESNEDTYINNFPIDSELKFTLSSEDSIKAWKKKYKISENASELDCINAFKEKYKINVDNVKDALKIIAIRYEITTNGYSSTKSIKIAENISKTSAIQFNEQNSSFPGINVVEEPIRVYTSGSLAAHILGYIGKLDQDTLKEKINDGYRINDYIGKVGIEYVLEKYLKGKTGKKQVDMSVDGTVIEEYVQEEAVSGNTVILTIDSEIQEKMEEAIEDEIEQLKNEGKQTDCGAAVLMNVKNGEILAMCSYPTFKPEYFTGKLDPDIWEDIQKNKKLFNNAVQSANAPGSTYKMVVATAALEEGVTTENEYINDRGVYPYGHNPVCWYYTSYHRGHGNVNIKTALQKSCNYFFYEMGRRLGADKIAEYARYYGLGAKTGVELTGEATGTIACSEEAQKQGEQWYPSYDLSAAIGQIYNRYSPIQMARYVSIIANGGNYVTPTLIKEVRDSDGNRIPKEEIRNYTNELLGVSTEQNSDLKISDKTLDTVKAGMRLVTSSGGTAYAAFKNFDKSVAGKTGSAQAKSKEKGEYANGWFVGFTPYQDSEVAVVVFLEDGSSNSHAAKVARKILEAYYNSDIENTEDLKEDMSAQIYAET